MTESNEYRPVTREELAELADEELPERAAMSLVNANIAIPVNAAVAANVLSDGAIAYADATQDTPIDQSSGGSRMTDTPNEYRALTREELNTLAGEELPERVAMSLINANLAAPVNVAVALNVASDNSVAYANAEQDVTIDQSN
jgi:hypothetical protein